MSTVTLNISEGIATITLNRPSTLNALRPEGALQTEVIDWKRMHQNFIDYEDLANTLREVDSLDDVFVTIWQGALLRPLFWGSHWLWYYLSMKLKGDGFARELPLYYLVSIDSLSPEISGTDVKAGRYPATSMTNKPSLRQAYTSMVSPTSTDCGQAVWVSSTIRH